VQRNDPAAVYFGDQQNLLTRYLDGNWQKIRLELMVKKGTHAVYGFLRGLDEGTIEVRNLRVVEGGFPAKSAVRRSALPGLD